MALDSVVSEPPSTGFSGMLEASGRQLAAVERHAAAEGYDFETGMAVKSYHRVLHPWLHGCRFEDLLRWVWG